MTMNSNFYFERECRTPSSECYTILSGEDALGRVDIHFAETVVHATMSIAESLTDERFRTSWTRWTRSW